MTDDPFADAEIQIEIRPDGTIRFEVAGMVGEGCEALEQLMLEALGTPVTDRERTAAFYQRTAASGRLADRLRNLLKR
jgi:hypothetical protein